VGPRNNDTPATTIVITNGKGGVGKTSLVANIAGLAAVRGIRTLAIDLDPQANLAGDFGARTQARRDDGRAMLDSACDFALLEPIAGVRPNIDLVAAGAHTRQLAEWMTVSRGEDPTVVLAVREAIAGIRNNYDLILIDTPPAPAVLSEAGIQAADWVLSPVRADFASIDGLEQVKLCLGRMGELGLPTPPMLGVVLFDVATQSTAVIEEIRHAVAEQADWAGPVFETVIRRSERSALDMRRWGLLAGEYRDRSGRVLNSEEARRRLQHQGLEEAAARFSRAADAVARDYDQLGVEVLERMVELVPVPAVSRPPLPVI
jgi:chromosome partitioning protein